MFIGAEVLERTKVDLKYCESCGALWLRKQGTSEANCGACELMWLDLPGAWIQRLKGQPERKNTVRQQLSEMLREGGRA